ncbi:MAG: tetratricopeptide repeat protein, partial [Acetobacteraceae bacterium]|nr:tetratricopeptide repeat protein [Acetobacteraceae bacterium]
WLAAGRPTGAASALEAWLARQPRDPAVLSTLAQIDLQAGRDEVARRRLLDVVQQQPGNAAALNNLAWLVQKAGTPAALAEARPLAERALFLAPTAEAADTLGWILARQGERDRGVALLRQAAATRPEPGMAFRLAWALGEAGHRAEARGVLEPLLAAGAAFPERQEAERLLARLRGG